MASTALARAMRRSRHTAMASAISLASATAPSPARCALMSTLGQSTSVERLGVGLLPLPPAELEAERELVSMLPDFQQAMDVLHSANDQFQQLPTTKRASLALPSLERTVEICRSAMGFNSAYLLAALRHVVTTQFAAGQYAAATTAMMERGEAMGWPLAEQERVLRLFLRQGQPARGLEWCQKDVFTALVPTDATLPVKWDMYELLAKTLQHGPSELHVRDPTFARAAAVLRETNDVAAHEIPHLLSQYGALSLAASDALGKNANELSESQQASVAQAEALWRDALAWVEQTKAHQPASTDELKTSIDAPFEAWIQANLGELLLHMNRTDEAMAMLGKALQTQQNAKGGNALALSRVLSKIARGCHANGQAVSSEGLFTSVLDAFEKEPHLSLTDQVEYATALRGYGALLKDWDKREKDSQLKFAKADEIDRAVAEQCARNQSKVALHPVFYLPL